MRITSEQLRAMMRERKMRKSVSPVKDGIRRAASRVGRFMFECFDGPGRMMQPFGISAGGLI